MTETPGRTLTEAMGMDAAELAQLRAQIERLSKPASTCFPTPESMRFVYYGATEPASALDWNPDCPQHPPREVVSPEVAW